MIASSALKEVINNFVEPKIGPAKRGEEQMNVRKEGKKAMDETMYHRHRRLSVSISNQSRV